MRQIGNVWSSLTTVFLENLNSWILFLFLCLATYEWFAEMAKLDDVCSMAREAIQITTPKPENPDFVLRQVEMPSEINGYPLREFWRWQQLDGPQIDKICP